MASALNPVPLMGSACNPHEAATNKDVIMILFFMFISVVGGISYLDREKYPPCLKVGSRV
jgi:hypothetical protein